jgi:Tol biopolymer transport system component
MTTRPGMIIAVVVALIAPALMLGIVGCGGSRSSFKWRDTEPSWSPSGKTITFVSNREHPHDEDANVLYVMKADGTALKKLTDDATSADFPSYSPDERTILYIAYPKLEAINEDPTIDVIGADGSGGHTVTTAANHWAIPPAWSRDGRRIAFARDRDATNPETPTDLWLMAPDGSGQRRVAKGIDTYGFSPAFAWSPDSRRIAFACFEGDLCLVSARGGPIRRLTHSSSDSAATLSVSWSPDGKQITFIRSARSDQPRLDTWVIDASGRDEHELPRFGEGNPEGVLWLPKHGRTLVAAGDKGRIYLVRNDGRGKRELQEGYSPTPSPDGMRLLFEVAGPYPGYLRPQSSKIFVITLLGRAVRQLTQVGS